MELKKNKKIYYSVISVCLLICAAVSRELAREEDGILLETILQFSRHLIHAGLLFIWMSTIKQRIMQASVRRYLLAAASLLVLWLYIRTCKWMFFPADSWANRYCWYAYYIALIGCIFRPSYYYYWYLPMIFINLFFAFRTVQHCQTDIIHMVQVIYWFPDGAFRLDCTLFCHCCGNAVRLADHGFEKFRFLSCCQKLSLQFCIA